MNPNTATAASGPATILYNGAVRLDFNPKAHSYTVTDERGTRNIPSVTQILGIIDKSGPLTQWAANQTSEYIRAAIRPGLRYDEIQLAGIIDQARFNFRSVSRNAKTIGQIAHEWIEGHLRARLWGGADLPLPVNEQARAGCQAAAAWIAQHFSPKAMEHCIYSREQEFAGTLDVYGEVDGVPAIVDWKTSAAIYREFRLQTAAYAAAWTEMHDERVPDRWVIRLDKETGEFEPVKFPREDYRADLRGFLAAKTLHMRLEAIKTPRAAKPKPILAAVSPADAWEEGVGNVAPKDSVDACREAFARGVESTAPNRPMAPVRAMIPAPPAVSIPPQRYEYAQENGLAPAVNGNEARLPKASAATVPQSSNEPRRPRSQRRPKQISYAEMGGALILSGDTYIVSQSKEQLTAHGSKRGGAWIWQVPANRFQDLAGLCAQNSIRLVAASGELHVPRA